jgi:hypothetical protein
MISQISSDTRITPVQFEERAGVVLCDFLNKGLKKNNSKHSSISKLQDKYPVSIIFDYAIGYVEGTKFSKDTVVCLTDELGNAYWISLYYYLLRTPEAITDLRKYFEKQGVYIDNDLKDLKMIL